MPYKHFGARLARLDRFDSCTLHHLLEGTATLRCCALANCSRNPALALAHPFIRGHSDASLLRPRDSSRATALTVRSPSFRAGSSTDKNGWPTTNRCGFDSRTAHHAGLARRSSPRSIIARCWFDSNILHQILWVTGRDGRCTRLLSETRLVQFQRHPPEFAGLADAAMHSPFKRDEAGSIPASRTRLGRGGIA